MVTETDNNIVVTAISDTAESSQDLYQIITRNSFGYTSAVNVLSMMNQTISLGERDGFQVASIVNQMPGWAAVWMLRCN